MSAKRGCCQWTGSVAFPPESWLPQTSTLEVTVRRTQYISTISQNCDHVIDTNTCVVVQTIHRHVHHATDYGSPRCWAYTATAVRNGLAQADSNLDYASSRSISLQPKRLQTCLSAHRRRLRPRFTPSYITQRTPAGLPSAARAALTPDRRTYRLQP